MTSVIIGKWGGNLAVRIPTAVAEAVGLRYGEAVEILAVHGDVMIRRSAARAETQRRAEEAAAEMEAESQHFRPGDESSRELLEEGRRV